MRYDRITWHKKIQSARPNFSSLTGNYIWYEYFTYFSIQILNILLRAFYSGKSDSPHKIMRYFVYYSKKFHTSFLRGRHVPAIIFIQMFGTTIVPVSKGHLVGASP